MPALQELNVYDDGDLRVEYDNLYATYRGVPLDSLARKEFLILSCLLRAQGPPLPHRELWQAVWGDAKDFNDPALRVHLTNLRRKLAPYGLGIASMIGVGYYLQMQPTAASRN